VLKLLVYRDDAFLVPLTIAIAVFLQWAYLPHLRSRVAESGDGLRVCFGGRTRTLPWHAIEAIELASTPIPVGFGRELGCVAVRASDGSILLLPLVHRYGALGPPRDALIRTRDAMRAALDRHRGDGQG
jgi:hypothetical protein